MKAWVDAVRASIFDEPVVRCNGLHISSRSLASGAAIVASPHKNLSRPIEREVNMNGSPSKRLACIRKEQRRLRNRTQRRLFCESLEARALLTTAPTGDQFVVAEVLGFVSSPPAITVQANGDFTAAWNSFEEDGSGFGVFAQRFSADGTEIDAVPFLVNATTAREQSAPAIASDSNGNVLVVWQSKGQDEGDTFGVFGQWYNSSGAKLGEEFRINSQTADDQKAPVVAIDGAGNAIVAWQSFGQDGSDWGCTARGSMQ